MKRMLLIFLLLGAFMFSACTQNNDAMIRVEDINCEELGYVSVSEANELISINNKLITLVNACYEDTGLDPLPYIKEYPVLE